MNPFDQKSGPFKLPEKPGMFELAKKDTCLDPSHSMPTHIYIPPGHGYKHVCPRCGHVSVATNTLTY